MAINRQVNVTVNTQSATQNVNTLSNSVNTLNSSNQSMLDRMSGMPGVVGTASSSIQGFGTALKALAANPIGAVLLVIVVAFTTLYNLLKTFAPVVDKLEQAFAGVSAVFGVLKDATMSLIVGVDDASFSFKNLGGTMASAAKDAAKLKKEMQDLEDQQELNDLANIKSKNTIDLLLIQSKDRTKTEAERIKALKDAEKEEIAIYNRNAAQADKALDIATRNMIAHKNISKAEFDDLQRNGLEAAKRLEDAGKLQTKDVENYAKALIKKEEILGGHNAFVEKRTLQSNKLIEKSEEDKEKAAAKREANEAKRTAKLAKQQDDEAKRVKANFDILVIMQGEADAERLATDKQYMYERFDLLDLNKEREIEDIKKSKKLNAEKELDILNVGAKYAKAKQNLLDTALDGQIKNLKYEVDLEKAKYDEQLTAKKLNNTQLHEEELKRIEKDRKANEDAQNLRLNGDPKRAEEVNKAIALINQNAKTATAQSDADFAKRQADIKEQNAYNDISNQIEMLGEANIAKFDLQAQQADMDRQKELANTELTEQEKANIEGKYVAIKKDLAQQELDYKVNTAKDLVNAVSSIMGEGTKAAKIAASTIATINMYQEISGIFASTAKWGPVGWALGIAKAATSAITGAATIKKIWAANGSNSASAVPNTAAIVPPSITATSNTLTSTEQNLQNKAMKVYVVESDITEAQSKVNVVKTESTF